MGIDYTLSDCALAVLESANATEKARKTRKFAQNWRNGEITEIGINTLPDMPARPDKPELRHPYDMPKRAKAGSLKMKIALLHALAHIELNAIDLAWDVMARFGFMSWQQRGADQFTLPREFFDDWMKVADDEAKHFLMLNERLGDLGASYGDLPAHNGLWESSQSTAHDFAARLAIVPMVLEARGLDVTPNMIKVMENQGDEKTASYLQIIHDDEITHVRAGTVWFEAWCVYYGHNIQEYWQNLVRIYFDGRLKRPFNHPSRSEAGMIRDWYEPLADELSGAKN